MKILLKFRNTYKPIESHKLPESPRLPELKQLPESLEVCMSIISSQIILDMELQMDILEQQTYLIEEDITNADKIQYFKSLPYYDQKSPEWLKQRVDRITASAVAAALGLSGNAAYNQLLIEKVSYGEIRSFNGNDATHWGNKFEPVANSVYSAKNHIDVLPFGMITNPKYPILGISPDGIMPRKMLEIKCPYSRVIDGVIKKEYYHQMQEQMAVCEYDRCDFLECKFEEISDNILWNTTSFHERGIIITYIDCVKVECVHCYSPSNTYFDRVKLRQWLETNLNEIRQSGDKLYIKQMCWELVVYRCQLVKRDPEWIVKYYPKLQAFWNKVEHYRQLGIDQLLTELEMPLPEPKIPFNKCLL